MAITEDTFLGYSEFMRGIIEDYYASLYGYAVAFTRDQDLASECMDYVFSMVQKNEEKLKSDCNLNRRLLGVAEKYMKKALKKRHGHDALIEPDIMFIASQYGELAPPDKVPQAVAAPTADFSVLTDAEHDAYQMHYLEHLPIPEVAKSLGISEAATKMRIYRAVDKLLVQSGNMLKID